MTVLEPRYEGPLERKTDKWKQFHAVLRNSQLYFYRTPDGPGENELVGTLKLGASTFCNSSNKVLARGYQFSVKTSEMEVNFRVRTEEQRNRWIKEIMGAVTELHDFTQPMSRVMSTRGHETPGDTYQHTLVVHEWYWPGITRDRAEAMLSKVEGSHFLVRDSGHEVGSYSLSVRVGKDKCYNFYHYIIKRDPVENKFILVPKPDERFNTLEGAVDSYIKINKNIKLKPLKNPAFAPPAVHTPSASYVDPASTDMTVNTYRGPSVSEILDQEMEQQLLEPEASSSSSPASDARANSYKAAVQNHPSVPESEQSQQENQYVRIGMTKCNNGSDEGSSPGKAPTKPVRPNIRQSVGESQYMNVNPVPQEKRERKDVITSTSADNSKYIYAALPRPLGATSESKVVIQGMERSVVSIEFGDPSGTGFSRNNSVFEELPPEGGADGSAGCYVNCELSSQMGNQRVSILEEPGPAEPIGPIKPHGKMSKASAKAAKNKMAKKQAAAAAAAQQYPPMGPDIPSYKDPCDSMAAKPSFLSRKEELEQFPVGPALPSYNDPATSLPTQPPPSSKSMRKVEEQFPMALPGAMAYTDPCISMAMPPPQARSGRHNGNV